MASYFYAVKTLLENRINELPLTSKTLEEMITREGWKIVYFNLNTQESVETLERLDILEYAEEHSGFSFKKGKAQIVFMQKGLSSENTTFILAHELGHIKSGHFSDTGILGKHSDARYDDQQEIEANSYARHLLAPECILKQIHIKTLDELESHTLLKGDVLKAQYAEYKTRKNKPTAEEKLLIGNFNNYIHAHARNSKIRHLTIACAAATLITVFGIGIYNSFHNDDISVLSNVAIIDTAQSEQTVFTKPDETTDTTSDIDNTITINHTTYNTNMTVYKAKTGTKFHKQDCRHIKNRQGVSTFSIEQAITFLSPCSDCF